MATITIASDFKGTITVEAKDKAGNTSDTKTIGTDGGGIKGIIVEDNAPKISCFVGAFALSEHYYDEAPELTVYVADDTNEYEETVLTGGIASVTYQVGSGSAKTVDHDYTSDIVTSDSFTIPAEEIPGGVTNVTVTATDHAGNQAVQSIIVRVKALEETPNAEIGYRAEKLTGLVANAVYLIDGAGMIADADGTIAIEENWMPATLSIVKLGDDSTTYNSEPQNLPVPARPAAPSVGGQNETYPNAGDGVLTELGAGTAYEISDDDGSTWKDADLNGTEIRGLAAGTYQVRIKAVEGVNFKSRASKATVGTTPATPYETPDAQIHYRLETLTGLVPNAEYVVEYGGETEEDEENEEENDTDAMTFKADADGNITIDETWFGMTLSIVRKGNGKEKSDSEAQSLPIPIRPQTPFPSGADETGLDRKR